jgi:hypothetical protein
MFFSKLQKARPTSSTLFITRQAAHHNFLYAFGGDAVVVLLREPGWRGADIGPIMREGVVGASFNVEGSRYFDIHHTPADTLDKIDPKNLALCVATMAVVAYTVADMPQPLGGSTTAVK